MPENGDARSANGAWEVFWGGAWVPLDDLDVSQEPGVVGKSIDPSGPRLVVLWDDNIWRDVEGNPVSPETGKAAVGGRPPKPAWWDEDVEATIPWESTGMVPVKDEFGLETGETAFDVAKFNRDFAVGRSYARTFGKQLEPEKEKASKPGVFASPEEADTRLSALGLGDTHEAVYSPKDDAYVIQEREAKEEAQPAAAVRQAPAQPSPTFDDEIDRLLYEWATTGSEGTLNKALELDAVRDQVQGQQGLSYAEAAQLAVENADSPEEAQRWIDVLTNPFGRPTQGAAAGGFQAPERFPTQQEVGRQFQAAAARPGAPPVEAGTRAFLERQFGGTTPPGAAGFGAFPPAGTPAPGGEAFPGFTFQAPQTPQEGAAFGRVFSGSVPGSVPPTRAAVPAGLRFGEEFNQVTGPLLPSGTTPFTPGQGFGAAETGEAQQLTGRRSVATPFTFGGGFGAAERGEERFIGQPRPGAFAPPAAQARAATFFPKPVPPAPQAVAGDIEPTSDQLAQAEAAREARIQADIQARGGTGGGHVALYNPQTGDVQFTQDPDTVAAYQKRGWQVKSGDAKQLTLPPAPAFGAPASPTSVLNPFVQTLWDIQQRKKQRRRPPETFRAPPRFVGAA